jgi:hypothetical protein
MYQFILRENVLTDNILTVANSGCVFKGGYIGYVEYNTFRNAWQDTKHTKQFRSKDRLQKYITKNYTQDEICDLDFSGSCIE